jgi:hypothetical protein
MHPRGDTGDQGHGAAGLHAGALDALPHAEPLGVLHITGDDGLVAGVQPLLHLQDTVRLHELHLTGDGASDATVPLHHLVRLRPVGRQQCHGLAVQVGILQRPDPVIEVIAVHREGLDQGAQLIGLERLLGTGVDPGHSTVPVVGRVDQPSVLSAQVQIDEAGLAIHGDTPGQVAVVSPH